MAYKFVPYAPGGSGGKDPILGELTVTENGVYDEPTVEGDKTITWDGVVGDKPCVYVDEIKTSAYVKVSDDVLSFDDFVGAVMASGGVQYDITEAFLMDTPDAGVNCAALILSVRDADAFDAGMGLTFPEEGTYFNISFASESYIESLTFFASTPADGWNKVTVNVAGDIIDVPELPTENIEEGKIYRVVREGEPVVWLATTYAKMPFDQFMLASPSVTAVEVYYHVVDTLPDTMEPTNINGFVFHIYVLNSTGVGYVSTDGTLANAGTLSAQVMNGGVNDFGWTDDIDSVEVTDLPQQGFYTVRGQSSTTYGIPDEANNKTVFEHTSAGGWAAVNTDIVDVIELPVANVDPNKIYRVTERSPEHIEVYISSGGQSYTLAGCYQYFNDYMNDGKVNSNGILPNVIYEAVDAVPSIEDISEEYLFPKVANYTEAWTGKCYILKSTGEPYIGVQGEGVMALPSMLSSSFGLPVTFTGFIDSLETIPSGDVVATVYVPGGESIAYGIPNAHPVKRLVDGVWTDLT